MSRRRAAAVWLALLTAGCATGNPDNIANFASLSDQIRNFYDYRAWEQGATCLTPQMLGMGRANVVKETTDQLVVDVTYAWQDYSYGGSRKSHQNGMGGHGGVGGSCFGQGERQFVVAKGQGGGYAVVSMTGAQRY